MNIKKISWQTLATNLVSRGILTKERSLELIKISQRLEKTFVRVLLDDRTFDKSDELMFALSEIYDIPYINSVEDIKIEKDLCEKIGISVIEKNKCAVIMKGSQLFLRVEDPTNNENLAALAQKIGDNVQVCTMSTQTYRQLYNRDITPLQIKEMSDAVESEGGLSEISRSLDNSSSNAEKVFSSILKAAIESRASDIHISKVNQETVVAYRIDGRMKEIAKIKPEMLDVFYRYLVSVANIVDTNAPMEPLKGQSQHMYNDRAVNIRINIIKAVTDSLKSNAPDINIRILDNDAVDISKLGLNEHIQSKLMQYFKMSKGIVLVVGPTGSGKSTTLYAGVRASDFKSKKYITVEDPVEQPVPGISQVNVNEQAGSSYPIMLKAFLRHDPDVIVIGEIRDHEVAKIAFEASNTGHLVFSTLHTNDAISVIARLIDLEIRPIAITDALSAVLAQRLVRKICPHCKEEYLLPKDHYWRTMFNLGDEEIKLYRGRGCVHCNYTGSSGRTVIAELLEFRANIRDAIEREATKAEIEKLAYENGFERMLSDGIRKALLGEISLEELEPFAIDIV